MADINIEYINELAENDPERLVRESEANYRAFADGIVRRVAEDDNIRIILLAGPSGSGKTTTANILSDGIKARGLESMVISLDDFYREHCDECYPRLENGERDYEAPEALDLAEIEKTMLDIVGGRDFTVPKYDFKVGGRVAVRKYPKISHGCVIIEGLHAMNPEVFEHLPPEKILRIFISVSTNINEAGERILSGKKLRFVRRMVRDSIYRGASAERTLKMWTGVLIGEDKYLYPYRKNADVDFNTFHAFEPCVMRRYVKELISDELAYNDGFARAVLSAMNTTTEIDENLVPNDSLIREFIDGGKYEEFY